MNKLIAVSALIGLVCLVSLGSANELKDLGKELKSQVKQGAQLLKSGVGKMDVLKMGSKMQEHVSHGVKQLKDGAGKVAGSLRPKREVSELGAKVSEHLKSGVEHLKHGVEKGADKLRRGAAKLHGTTTPVPEDTIEARMARARARYFDDLSPL